MEDKTKWEKVRPLDKRTTDKPPNQNRNMFFIRTPFSMILGLLEDTHKLYKIMHIHIIVHHVRRRTQEESLTSLQKMNR
jgi:hypothetical protein